MAYIYTLDHRPAQAVLLVDSSGNPLSSLTTTVTGTVDTELPAAALLADNTALPTAPLVGAVGMLYDGATLDMARSKGTGWQGFALVRGSDGIEMLNAEGEADGIGLLLMPAVGARTRLWNGATYDRARSNEAITVSASAARTTTLTTSDQTNYNGRWIEVFINISAFTSGGLTPKIQGKDPVSGTYYDILTGAKLVAAGMVMLTVTPNFAAVANLVAQAHLPRTWRVICTPDDATSITYSIGAVTGV